MTARGTLLRWRKTNTAQHPHIDTTHDVTVGNFNGDHDKWPAWRLKFEAFCDLHGWGRVHDAHRRPLILTTIHEESPKRVESVKRKSAVHGPSHESVQSITDWKLGDCQS